MAIANIKHVDQKSSFYIAISEISTSHKTFKLNKFEELFVNFQIRFGKIKLAKRFNFLEVSEKKQYYTANSKSHKNFKFA